MLRVIRVPTSTPQVEVKRHLKDNGAHDCNWCGVHAFERQVMNKNWDWKREGLRSKARGLELTKDFLPLIAGGQSGSGGRRTSQGFIPWYQWKWKKEIFLSHRLVRSTTQPVYMWYITKPHCPLFYLFSLFYFFGAEFLYHIHCYSLFCFCFFW